MIHPSAAVTYYCDCPEIAKRNVRHASLGRKINTIRPRRQKETGCTLYGVWSSTFRVDVRECNIADQAGVISKEEDTASNTRGKYQRIRHNSYIIQRLKKKVERRSSLQAV